MVLPHPLSLAKAAAEILMFRKEINNSLEQCRNCKKNNRDNRDKLGMRRGISFIRC